jgi:putative membrane protein
MTESTQNTAPLPGRDWLSEAARRRVTAAIKKVEGVSSVEVVVTLKRASACYRHADYLVGAGLALVALCLYIFLPVTFTDDVVPLLEVLVFATGALLSASLPPLRRLLLGRAEMEAAVRAAARVAFVDQGVSRTTGRTGVLVLLSLLERRAEVVADVGVDPARLGEDWRRAPETLSRAAFGAGGGSEAFARSLEALAVPLARALPRAADDVNELPDEVVTA